MHCQNFSTEPVQPRFMQNLVSAYRINKWNLLKKPRFLAEIKTYPNFVLHCPTTMEMISFLKLFDWNEIAKSPRDKWFNELTTHPTAYIGSFLIKITLKHRTMTQHRRFLKCHPALIWALGFPLRLGHPHFCRFDPEKSLPSSRHFTRVLRELDPTILARMLSSQVSWMKTHLPSTFAEVISLDTKHIIAWVKENNPKAYIKEGRFAKEQQPAGDSDCKLGCKRRHNRITPTKEGRPGSGLPVSVGEFYWGYASGIIVTKVAGIGEFVLAEMTQTFDKGDTTYFFPLMKQVEARLGFRPTYFTADAAFDAFYIYDYFHDPEAGGFAAIPFSQKGGKPDRQFDESGTPVCEAGLSMLLKMTFNDNTTSLIPYRRQKYVCPLLHPEKTGDVCPVSHKRWPKGGCTTTLAESVGSRIRHQLDRECDLYKSVFQQRTAVERLFSQSTDLGMERPKLRNAQAIANQNTLIYLIINAKAIRRAMQVLNMTR